VPNDIQYFLWNVDQWTPIAVEDYFEAFESGDPEDEVNAFVEANVSAPEDIDNLPEPLQPYAYKYLLQKFGLEEGSYWKNFTCKMDLLTGTLSSDCAAAKIWGLNQKFPETITDTDAWVLTPDGWIYVPPFNTNSLDLSLFSLLQNGGASEIKGMAAYWLGSKLGTRDETLAQPAISALECYRLAWENSGMLNNSPFDHLHQAAGISYLRKLLEDGNDIHETSEQFKKIEAEIDPDKLPEWQRRSWHFIKAMLTFEMVYGSDKVSEADMTKLVESLLVGWQESGFLLLRKIYYTLRLINNSLGLEDIEAMIKNNMEAIKEAFKKLKEAYKHPDIGDSETKELSDAYDKLEIETNVLAGLAIYAAFLEAPKDLKVWERLNSLLQTKSDKESFVIENESLRSAAANWVDFLKGNDPAKAKASGGQTILTLIDEDLFASYKGIRRLRSQMWGKLLPIITPILQEREAWDLIAFLEKLKDIAPANIMAIAEAYRKIGFYSFVASKNLAEVHDHFKRSCDLFNTINLNELTDDEKAEYFLKAGAAWSQYSEFLVDHGGELVEAGKVKDNAEVEKNIYKYNGVADELLDKAREGDAENAEVYVKRAWNDYYIAKFTRNFEKGIKTAEAYLQVVEQLYKQGKADKQQLSSAIRCLMWNYTEKTNKLLIAGSYDSALAFLNKAIPLADKIFYQALDEKEVIDALWLKFRTSYLLARTFPHPGRMLDTGKDGVEPLSDESARSLDKAEAVFAELKTKGETEGEISRMKGWVYYRRGDFDTAEDLFRSALKLGCVKHRDDTLRGIMLCNQLSFLSQPNIPVTEKQQLLENWAKTIYERFAIQKDVSVLANLEQVCKKAASIGYKLKAGERFPKTACGH